MESNNKKKFIIILIAVIVISITLCLVISNQTPSIDDSSPEDILPDAGDDEYEDFDEQIGIKCNFNTNGGTLINDVYIEENGILSKPSDPIKEGYNFVAWFTNDKLTLRYNFTSLVTEELTLYAKWEASVYNIIYDVGDGTNDTSNPITYTIESETIIILDAIPPHGYIFECWIDKDFNKIEKIEKGCINDVLLTAKYQIQTICIIFDSLNGTTNEVFINFKDKLEKPSDPVKSGYYFVGWFTDMEMLTRYDFNSEVTLSFTLYAGWEDQTDIRYNIIYNTGAGVNNLSNPVDYTFNSNTIMLFDAISPNGYEFDYWEDELGNKVVAINEGSTGDIELTAVYKLQTYTITYVYKEYADSNSNKVQYNIESEFNLVAPNNMNNDLKFSCWIDENNNLVNSIKKGSFGNLVLYIDVYTNEIQFENNNVLKYEGESSNVIVPNYYNGNPINIIDNKAFFNLKTLINIIIGNNVTLIGESAFSSCVNLETVILGKNVIEIEKWAFNACLLLKEINLSNIEIIGTGVFTSTSIVSADISNVTQLGSNAFLYCRSLVDVQLSEHLKVIEQNTFRYCKSLVSINLKNVASIGDLAFHDCSNFMSVDLTNVSEVGNNAFQNCSSLINVDLGNLTIISDYMFSNCYALQSINLSKIEVIGKWAFDDCELLYNVDIANVETIGEYAFSNCLTFTEIYISNNVKSIDESAFWWCTIYIYMPTTELDNKIILGKIWNGNHSTVIWK